MHIKATKDRVFDLADEIANLCPYQESVDAYKDLQQLERTLRFAAHVASEKLRAMKWFEPIEMPAAAATA